MCGPCFPDVIEENDCRIESRNTQFSAFASRQRRSQPSGLCGCASVRVVCEMLPLPPISAAVTCLSPPPHHHTLSSIETGILWGGKDTLLSALRNLHLGRPVGRRTDGFVRKALVQAGRCAAEVLQTACGIMIRMMMMIGADRQNTLSAPIIQIKV